MIQMNPNHFRERNFKVRKKCLKLKTKNEKPRKVKIYFSQLEVASCISDRAYLWMLL